MKLFSSASFVVVSCTPFGVSLVVCGRPISACLRHGRYAAAFTVMLWRVNGSAAREPLPCTHPSTPNTRLDTLQEPLLAFGMTRPGIEPRLPDFGGACSNNCTTLGLLPLIKITKNKWLKNRSHKKVLPGLSL